MTGNNPNLDLVNMNAYIKFGEIMPICIQDIERKRNSDLKAKTIKKYVTNESKLTGNNPNLDLVNMNAYIKFGEIMPICIQDIERKRNSDVNQGP